MSEPKRQCIIFDIDGTAALRGDRDPYNMARVGEDEPNLPVLFVAQALFAYLTPGHGRIFFTSGRDETARKQTEMWLDHHFGSTRYSLFMRATGDNRPDDEVKLEMLQQIRETHNIIAAFDDRDRVVKMWRDNGVTCFQVAYGDF